MDAWIEIARGPLFRIALAVLIFGLLYRVGAAMAQIVATWRRAGDRRLPLAAVARATASWLVPVRLLKAKPAYAVLSLFFHVGIIALPLFLAGHVALVRASVGVAWAAFPPVVADALTLVTLAALVGLLVGRFASASSRALTRPSDALILLLLIVVVGCGFLAAHPGLSPFAARTMLLLHVLAGDLALALTPLSKIAHCIIYPFTQLIFELAWHFPAASGRDVAVALSKEGEPV